MSNLIITSANLINQNSIHIIVPNEYANTIVEYALYRENLTEISGFRPTYGSTPQLVKVADTYPIEYNPETCTIRLRLSRCKESVSSSSSSSSNSSNNSSSSSNIECYLFDKDSWLFYNMPEKIRNALNKAADVWNSIFCLDSSVVNFVKQNSPSWEGITLDNFNITFSNDNWLASCGPQSVADILDADNVKYNTINFVLNVNSRYINTVNDLDWKWIFVHELGHALGIGTLWNRTNNFWLKQSYYPLTGNAYNNLINDTRLLIPIEDAGGAGTQGGHWEDNSRNPTYPNSNGFAYPGIPMDIMVGAIVLNQSENTRIASLTQVTINNIIDIGYIPKSQWPINSLLIANDSIAEPDGDIIIQPNNSNIFHFNDSCKKYIFNYISHDYIIDKENDIFISNNIGEN